MGCSPVICYNSSHTPLSRTSAFFVQTVDTFPLFGVTSAKGARMSHPFGDLLSRYLHRKHGLSQSKLAEGILQDPSVITKMCKGQRLTGNQARERVLAILDWLRTHAAIETVMEANALLTGAGMAPLRADDPGEQALLEHLQFPPLPTHASTDLSSAVTPRRTNLPAALTSFIGRTQELSDVVQGITTQRLVTLTGAGGVGKTRLATEVGIRLVQHSDASGFADGVWLAELADLSRPTLVVPALLRLFKLPEPLAQTPLELLQAYLADKQLLLILDNCEHLVDACADVVERLLHQCWHLRVLATSREELRIPGELIYPVRPLPLPDPLAHTPAEVFASPAAQLFVERIGAGHPMQQVHRDDAATIAHICHQLDGIPLALELAAPLTHSLSFSEIAAQLQNQMALLRNTYRTAIPRHQTMHRALVWSYRLLALAEQQLLAKVSVFAGGWTLEAAHAMCDGQPKADLLFSLQELVAKSLVLVDNRDGRRRYRLLEPVRQFARAQLAGGGAQDALQQQHAAYYLSFVESAEAALHGPQQKLWLDRLEADHDNLRTALAWSLADTPLVGPGDRALAALGGARSVTRAETGARLAGALWRFWLRRGYLSEGVTWLLRALARVETAPPQVRARALIGAGILTRSTGNYADAQRLLDESLTIGRTFGDIQVMVAALDASAGLAQMQHNLAQAQALAEEGVALAHELRDSRSLADALSNLAWSVSWQGNTQQAEQLGAEVLNLRRKQGDIGGIAWTLGLLGNGAHSQGDYERATTLLAESLAIFRELDEPKPIAMTLGALGWTASYQGDQGRAIALLEESLAMRRKLGDREWCAYGLHDLGIAELRQGDYTRAAAYFQASLPLFQELGSMPGITYCLRGFADLAAGRGQPERAAKLFGAYACVCEVIAFTLAPNEQPTYDRMIASVRAALGDAAFATAWAEGRTMPLEQAIAYAVEESAAHASGSVT